MNRLLTPTSNSGTQRHDRQVHGRRHHGVLEAPLDDPEHEANACDAALDMLERLEALNAERKQEAEQSGKLFIPIKMGIGLNTGKCVVGNMGSNLRFQYSVLGDSVNLASRLEY